MEHPAGVQSGPQTGSQQPPPPDLNAVPTSWNTQQGYKVDSRLDLSSTQSHDPAGVQSGLQTGSQQPPPPPDLNAVPTSWNTQQGYKVLFK